VSFNRCPRIRTANPGAALISGPAVTAKVMCTDSIRGGASAPRDSRPRSGVSCGLSRSTTTKEAPVGEYDGQAVAVDGGSERDPGDGTGCDPTDVDQRITGRSYRFAILHDPRIAAWA